MRLTEDDARTRFGAADHAILCTSHPERGIDAVPVCFAVNGDDVGIPVDLVKPKASSRLQRERNLEVDPRATLLVEQWDPDDWSQLWWVRAELRWFRDATDRASHLADLLAERYVQYETRPFSEVLVLEIVGVFGWAASPT